MVSRIGWRTVAGTAAGGALVALATLALLASGSKFGWRELLELGHTSAIFAIAGAGGLAGTLLALPGALPRPIVHPSFGLWVMLAFGNIDWLWSLEGGSRVAVQLGVLCAITAAAARYRESKAQVGLAAGTALAIITLTPIAAVALKDATAITQATWWYGEPGLGEQMLARASELKRYAHELPDIYLVVPDRYPSPAEAERRGYPYPQEALARLRARGWQIRDEALTLTPRTAVTLASTFALTTSLTDGTRVETAHERVKSLYETNRLRWRQSFAEPLLLRVLARAGYETRGWIGWWLPMDAVPFDRIDRSQTNLPAGTLGEAVRDTWLWLHLGWTRRIDEKQWGRVARSTQANCRELAHQRERFFAADDERDGRRPPRFVLYHVFWLHDLVNMNSAGECAGADEDAAFEIPHGFSDWRIALCRRAKIRGTEQTEWAPGCLPDEVRAKRSAAMTAYLPTFLERLEAHARRRSGSGGFRILVLSDEGVADAHQGVDRDSAEWWDTHWRRHPAVLRATYAEDVPELWDQKTIPDMPQAMRAVIEQLLGS